MAKLEEVLPAFRAGKKIKRSHWTDSLYSDELSSQVSFNRDALFSNDWEILEEKKNPEETIVFIDQGFLKPQEFKAGDLAWSPSDGWEKVTMNSNGTVGHCGFAYRVNGNILDFYKYPSLLSVENAALLGFYPQKKKKKVTFDRWFNVYPGGVGQTNYSTKDSADLDAGLVRIDCQKKTFEIEIEVDE